MALSGVRSSCDSVARNSSFSRLASCSRSSSSARSRCEDSISSSMRLKASTSTPISSFEAGLARNRVIAAIGNLARGAGQRGDRPRHDPLQRERQQEGEQQAAEQNRGHRGALGGQPRRRRIEIAHEQYLAAGTAAAGQLLGHFEPVRREARARRHRRAGTALRRTGRRTALR